MLVWKVGGGDGGWGISAWADGERGGVPSANQDQRFSFTLNYIGESNGLARRQFRSALPMKYSSRRAEYVSRMEDHVGPAIR
jgi:hypothetical protein